MVVNRVLNCVCGCIYAANLYIATKMMKNVVGMLVAIAAADRNLKPFYPPKSKTESALA